MIKAGTLHVFTVGVSILKNAARDRSDFLDIAKQLGFSSEKLRFQGRLIPQKWTTVEELEKLENNDKHVSRMVNLLLDYTRSNPRAASAELNAFLGILGRIEPRDYRRVGVALIYTKTSESSLASLVLKRYLEERGHPTRILSVEGYEGPSDFPKGLLDLVRVFNKLLSETSGPSKSGVDESNYSHVMVNATGGFKPEAAFITITSFLLPHVIAVYYIHEEFRDVVMIPRFPVSIDRHWLCTLLKLENIDQGTARQIVDFSDVIDWSFQDLKELGLIHITKEGLVRVAPWIKELQYLAHPHEPCPGD